MQRKNGQLMINLVASVFVFVVQFVINFWLSPFVVSRLGEEAYGFITLANNFTQYATLITVAINSMASRFISLEYNKGNIEKANSYFTSVFWTNVVLAVAILLLSSAVIFRLEKLINIEPALIADVKWTFAISFVNLMVSCLATCFTATTFATNRMDYHAFIQICSNCIRLFMTVGPFLILVPHIYYVSFASLSAALFSFVLYILLQRKLIPEFSLHTTYFSFRNVLKLAKSGIWILVSNISSLLLNGMDLLIANLYINQIAMSRLSISKQLPTAIGGLLGFLANIFAASFTTYVAENNKNALVEEIHFTCRVLGFFLTVPFAGLIVMGQDFFILWLPQNVYDIHAIKEIYILMLLTLINVIINAYMYSIHSLFIAVDKVRVYAGMVFVSSIISIVVTIVLVKSTNLEAYAIAGTSTAVLGFVNLILVPRYAEYLLELKPFAILKTIFRNYMTLMIVCLIFYGIRSFVNVNTWIRFCLDALLLGLLGYTVCFFTLFDKSSRNRLFITLRKKLGRNGDVQ